LRDKRLLYFTVSLQPDRVLTLPCVEPLRLHSKDGTIARQMMQRSAMNHATLHALAVFPDQLEAFFAAIPLRRANWAPSSWEGIPSESFTPIGQICHVRDIEIDGYQVRIARALAESQPTLPAIDGYHIAKVREYSKADPAQALATFRSARRRTLDAIERLEAADLERRAVFEGYGLVTVRGLIHYLCSHDQQHLAGLQWLLGRMEAP
jgi:hypothetical protein